jgi:hypothetical protein
MALRRAYLYRVYSFIVPFLLLCKPSEINRTMYSWISSKAKFYFKKKRESILCVCVCVCVCGVCVVCVCVCGVCVCVCVWCVVPVLTQCCVMRPEVYHEFQSASLSLSYATVLMCHLTLLLLKDH